MSPVGVLGYACISVHGDHPSDFWRALVSGSPPKSYAFPAKFRGDATQLEFLTAKLFTLWRELKANAKIAPSDRFGIIFASTKGCIDDYIWDEKAYTAHAEVDSISPVLENFLKRAEITPALSTSVSNACASSLSAVFLGMHWIRQKRVDQVLVLSADLAGPFVKKGFYCLNALSPTRPKPFAKDRDGLALGEAITAILIGGSDQHHLLQVDSVGLNAEGYAVTRPSPSGTSLKRAYFETSKPKPDLIIAHGTATLINDSAEDEGFYELFKDQVPITATKWSIGHTLGASGSMDLIAAFECLKRKRAFPIGGAEEFDPALRSRYLSKELDQPSLKTILVSSLGFGGVHAIGIVTDSRRSA